MSRYRRLFEAAQDGILLLNAETAQIEDVNPYLVDMLGYSHAEFLGKKIWDVGPFADKAQSKEMFTALQRHGYVRYDDLPLKTKSGVIIQVEFVSNAYDCDGIRVIQCNVRNISQRHADQASIRHLTQLYATLSQCNKAIVHCKSDVELLQTICRVAVQFGGMKMAWVGLINSETRLLQPQASFGDDTAYLKNLIISTDSEIPSGQSPAGRAISERQPVWCQDFLNDASTALWHGPARLAGLASSASIPLTKEGQLVGVFTLYAVEPQAFGIATRNLLIEMAEDISFALDRFASEERRRSVEEEVKFKNTILKTQQETSLDGILIVSDEGKIISYNQQFVDLWNLAPELIGARLDAPVLRAVATQVENPRAFIERIRYLNLHREGRSREELRLLDGRIIDRYSAPVIGADLTHYGRVWYFRDITERKRATQKFEDLLESAPDAMLIVDASAQIVLVNAQAVQLFGWSRAELLAKKVHALVPKMECDAVTDGSGHCLELLREQIQSAGPALSGIRKDGSLFPVEITLSPMQSDEGLLLIAAIRDVTQNRKYQERISYLNRVYAMMSGINTLIVRTDNREELFKEACRIAVDGGFRMALIALVDQGSQKLVPVASQGKDDDLLSAITSILSSDADAAKTMSARALMERRAIVSNRSQGDPQVLFSEKYIASGIHSMAVFPLLVGDKAVGVLALYAGEIEFFHGEELKLLAELTGNVSFAIDHIEKQEHLNYFAYYDALTGLANQRLFLERVAQAARSGQGMGHKVAIALIDLERFKNINDSLGHIAGDELLRKMAQWLIRSTGDANLLARLGADHFAVLIPVVHTCPEVELMTSQMMKALQEHPFRLSDAIFRIAAKVGIAIYPADGADEDTLFRNAEVALKKAKSSGERYLLYTQSMNELVAGKLTLENELRLALQRGEFVLHYQPKVNLLNGEVTGAEALIRWNKPQAGLVAPGHFIPVLEEIGLIHEVGRWAMAQACADHRRWHAAGMKPVRIAVNVSALQLRNRTFFDEVRVLIEGHTQAETGLELEITESLIMEDVKHSIISLQAIRALGLTIAIDDFGTGFSSLSYLSKLPVDSLKIDRSFVSDMTLTPEGLALVSTIINLAHALKLKVVAEGVETEEQARLLRLLNCDEIQGYLFSKPVPADVFESLFLVLPSEH
ncbi:EAL domain-containing protein [Rhodoferax sp. GW822-FHT02A01]|uniref:EAL domain-containing protein n=1 Tax=Rhodoferax sp. GW822-FHT02A01 TaxID=3141537 RepID=UPI00315D568F